MIRVSDIQRFCMHDGPGVRTTVFLQGCPLRCDWCHNPETQSQHPQLLFYADKCIGCRSCAICPRGAHVFDGAHAFDRAVCIGCGTCAEACPTGALEHIGTSYTADALLEQICKDVSFYGECGGVTFSGGECMLRIEPLTDVVKACKSLGIHVAIDTCGHVPFAHFQKILPYVDLFLYDVKCIDADLHRRHTGADNALILDNLQKLISLDAPLCIRVPIIPTFNDSVSEMERIKAFLAEHGYSGRVELLPYHPMGESKCRALGRQSRVFSVPDAPLMQSLAKVFE